MLSNSINKYFFNIFSKQFDNNCVKLLIMYLLIHQLWILHR